MHCYHIRGVTCDNCRDSVSGATGVDLRPPSTLRVICYDCAAWKARAEKAERERDLGASQLAMLSSEVHGDSKLHWLHNRADPRWTPALHEAWSVRAKVKELASQTQVLLTDCAAWKARAEKAERELEDAKYKLDDMRGHCRRAHCNWAVAEEVREDREAAEQRDAWKARAEKAERALADARDAALEEAAKVVDERLQYPGIQLNGGKSDTDGRFLRPIAKKIRALKGKKP